MKNEAAQPIVEVRNLKEYFNINMGMFRTKPLKAVDNVSFAIQPGETANVCQVFSLNDMYDVTLEAGEAFSFSDSQFATQKIIVQ